MAGVAALCAPQVIRAQQLPRLELNLLFDCSGSMYTVDVPGSTRITVKDHDVQREGHIEALLDPVIREVLVAEQAQVRLYGWSNTPSMFGQIDIAQISHVDDLRSLIDTYVPRQMLGNGGTNHALALFPFVEPPANGIRRVIDVSTDQAPSVGLQAQCVGYRERIDAYGGQINALAVDRGDDFELELELARYLVNGFVQRAYGWQDYTRAIRQKLLTELHAV